jgi:hypothetical protein
MPDIKVLMVLDGGRLNFGPQQTGADADYFGVTTLVKALSSSTTPTIQVDTAHRRGYTFNSQVLNQPVDADNHENCSLGLTYAGDFVFAMPAPPASTTHLITADLGQYDVLWLIGDEGYNGGELGTNADSEITVAEQYAIATFMESGGGVFAVGDHDGIGAYMCGLLPRVRTMRRWFEWDHQFTDTAVSGQIFEVNWSAAGDAAIAAAGGPDPITDRNDTLQQDSASSSSEVLFYFNDQSDARPQTLMTSAGTPLATSPGPIHSILRGSQGTVIAQFPDHMHEGEATDFATLSATGSPYNPNDGSGNPWELEYPNPSDPGHPHSIAEFPSSGGVQAVPEVIAYTHDSGHSTYAQTTPTSEDTLGDPSYGLTNPKTRGAISVYDGHVVGKGRVITGSTFHHYLDKNLIGDPGTAGTGPGPGPTGSNTGLPSAVLEPITQYYVNAVTWLAPTNQDFQFWTLKSTFGADEADDAPPTGFPNAFYIVVDGYQPPDIDAASIAFSGPFAAVAKFGPPGAPVLANPGSPGSPQRVLIPFAVTSISAGAFPPAGPDSAPVELALEARLTVSGQALYAEALFQLTAGADPYFTNVNAESVPPNVFYLSQDLRVFQASPGIGNVPLIAWPEGGTGYDYIQAVLAHLNDKANGYTTGAKSGNDPFTVLNEAGDLVNYSSVAPVDYLPFGGTTPNYNFAIARVRLKGGSVADQDSATNVRVFFRLFATVSNDTDFDPQTTYPSTYDAANLPATPLTGFDDTTYPMFATEGGTGDFVPALNARSITSAGDETWAFFGCYLDINFSIILPGTHHCLVAQIAYDPTPIVNSNGITLSPESTNLLAQRNIQVTSSGNPGGPAAHRVPQTFDTRPSTRTAAPAGDLAGLPDELMIDWGATPLGSTASIYWPQAAAIDVVRLANLLYPGNSLQVVDEYTVQCTVTSRVTYVPVPFGSMAKLAGLLTVDLPLGVRAGQEFHIVVRRFSSRQLPGRVAGAQASGEADARLVQGWRYLVGTFQVDIPVDVEANLLLAEENTLAIMKWRLQQLPPGNRWYPVLVRYIGYLAGRVDGFGGNSGTVVPSPVGVEFPPSPVHGRSTVERTGKVCEVIFDCFGDFEGFVLETCSDQHRFASRERGIGDLALRACTERLVVSVITERHRICRILIRG